MAKLRESCLYADHKQLEEDILLEAGDSLSGSPPNIDAPPVASPAPAALIEPVQTEYNQSVKVNSPQLVEANGNIGSPLMGNFGGGPALDGSDSADMNILEAFMEQVRISFFLLTSVNFVHLSVKPSKLTRLAKSNWGLFSNRRLGPLRLLQLSQHPLPLCRHRLPTTRRRRRRLPRLLYRQSRHRSGRNRRRGRLIKLNQQKSKKLSLV
jgi:hypothetical protein